MMTRQEAFDAAYRGVVAQGCASRDSLGCCLRGPNGTKCAIGHLLTDEQIEKYNIANGSTANAAFVRLPIGTIFPDVIFLSRLQMVHDICSGSTNFVENYKDRMTALAFEHGLKVPA